MLFLGKDVRGERESVRGCVGVRLCLCGRVDICVCFSIVCMLSLCKSANMNAEKELQQPRSDAVVNMQHEDHANAKQQGAQRSVASDANKSTASRNEQSSSYVATTARPLKQNGEAQSARGESQRNTVRRDRKGPARNRRAPRSHRGQRRATRAKSPNAEQELLNQSYDESTRIQHTDNFSMLDTNGEPNGTASLSADSERAQSSSAQRRAAKDIEEEQLDVTRTTYYPEDVDADATPGLSGEVLDAVVKIYATHCDPNYSLPWQMRRQTQSTSSGFVIAKRRILTNAHSVEHFTVVKVKKRGSDHKYIARVLAIGNECDIALLTVHDEDFWNDLKPLKFGTLPELQASVIVVGYPIGGENISVTAGVVSRVEIQEYTHGASQVSFAIPT